MAIQTPTSADEFHHRDEPLPVAPRQKAPPPVAPPFTRAAPPLQRTPPARPALPVATGPPVAPLAKLGYWGSIHDFNNAVQTMHDYYTKFEGGAPDKTTMLTSALQHAQHVQNGFNPPSPLTKDALKGNGYRVVRHDGYTEPNTPLRQVIYGRDQYHDIQAGPYQPADLKTFQALQKQHPWVQAGMLPLPKDLNDAMNHALGVLNVNNPDTQPLVEGGETLPQYMTQKKIAAEAIISGTPNNPAQLSLTGNNPQDRAATALARKSLNVGASVNTLVEVQNRLKAKAPELFPDSLPSNGVMNADWAAAIRKYSITPLAFRQNTEQLAHNNGFGNDVGAFTKAWAAKQQALKTHPYAHNLIMATPLFVYSNSHWAEVNHFTGNTSGAGWLDLPSWGLHTLSTAASDLFGEIGGALDSTVADADALAKYVIAISPKNTYWFWTQGGGKSERVAREDALKVMQESHPGIINLFDPNYGGGPVPDGQGGYKTQGGIAEAISTAVFDIMISTPRFTGEFLRPGQTALKSRYFNYKTKFFYDAIKAGGPGAVTDAVSSLEGGAGAKALATHLEKGIQDGTVSLQDVRKYTNDLFMKGRTRVPAYGKKTVKAALEGEKETLGTPKMITISGAQDGGALLRSLRTRGLPTPTRVGLKAQEIRRGIGRVADGIESGLQADTSKFSGVTNHAGTFIAHVRQLGARAEPGNDLRAISDERLPEDVYNWTLSNKVSDKEQALKWSDQMIRLQARGDTAGILKLHTEMRDAFKAEHPSQELRKPFELTAPPVLESESKSYLYFPDSLDHRAQKIAKGLNQAGRLQREVIVYGPFAPSIAWKHAIDDTARRVLGGGGLGGRGTEGMDEAVQAVKAYLRENPDRIRDLGVAHASTEIGEQRYITEAGVKEDPQDFKTSDIVDGKPVFEDPKMMRSAGRYLRHNLSSNALRAYQRSTIGDLQNLRSYLLQSRDFRSLMFRDEGYRQKLADIRAAFKPPKGQLLFDKESWKAARDAEIKGLQDETAHDYAEMLFKRYKEIEVAGKKAGVEDPLNEALGVLIDNLGASSDQALGDWLKEKKIELPIRGGLVEQSRWDDWITTGIHLLMTPNRWNRRVMFNHIFYGTVGDLTKVGWAMEDAMPVAADLAKFQTIYHMLDFANMLKVEKDYRYLAWFLTKRRLYWTRILTTAKQRPGLALAVADIRGNLDPKGNFNFTIAGQRFNFPVTKLFWLNETGQPETSPLAQYVANVIRDESQGQGASSFGNAFTALSATSGNLFTRADQTVQMAGKLALIETGIMGATSDSVTAGMGSLQKLYFQEEVNKYSAFYHQQHGVWPSEADAVKAALVYGMAQDFWRNYQPLPINWDDPTVTPPETQKAISEYHRITNPAKAINFLDKHPDVGLRLGVSQDPAVFLHNNKIWDLYNNARSELESKRNVLYQEMVTSGYTLNTVKQMSKLSQWWSGEINHLMLIDAGSWGGSSQFPAGQVTDGQVARQGPWTTQLEGDPFFTRAFVHDAFPGVKPRALDAGTVGETVVQLRATSKLFRKALNDNNPQEAGQQTIDQVRTTLSNISKTLAPFNGSPRDAATAVQNVFYKNYVDPYRARAKKLSDAANASSEPNIAHDALRAFKDAHDHPVTIQYKGHTITFPSPVRVGWALLPSAQRRQALAQAVAGNWGHVASYEKDMLGIPRPADVSAGWAFYTKTLADYNANPNSSPVSGEGKLALAEVLDQSYPGFLADYRFSLQAKINRFEYTDLYRTMPDRAWFDQNIGSVAKQIAAKIVSDGHSSYYGKVWKEYVKTQIEPYLAGQPLLARELKNYGPLFLNTLVSHG